jgi:hypothetical protein
MKNNCILNPNLRLVAKRYSQLLMNPVKTAIFLFVALGIYGCRSIPKEEHHITTFSSGENWQYFELEKAIEIKIINHLPAPTLCGNFAFASVTIAETKEGEKIRILDLCNTFNYAENEMVKVWPAKKPEFNVMFPNRMLKNLQPKQNEPFKIDLEVLKTAYGSLPKK